jgi:hypothetical protein
VFEFELAFSYLLSVAASFPIFYNVFGDQVHEVFASSLTMDAKENLVVARVQVLASVPFDESLFLLFVAAPIISNLSYGVHVNDELDLRALARQSQWLELGVRHG